MDKKDLELIPINTESLNNVDGYDLKNADYELLVQMGIDVSEAKGYASWVLGKLGDTVMLKYGDLKKYAQDINQNYFSIQQYTNVYRKFIAEDPDFSIERYSGSVPWGALMLAAGLSEKPAKLIEGVQVKGEEVNMRNVAHQALEAKHGHTIPRKPQIKIIWDEDSGKYKLAFQDIDLPYIDFSSVKTQIEKYLNSLG